MKRQPKLTTRRVELSFGKIKRHIFYINPETWRTKDVL